MRHGKDITRLGRSGSHWKAMVASLVCSLIVCKRIKTTLAKARLARRQAEKLVTLGKKGTLAGRRLALAILRDGVYVEKLFKDIVPQFSGRNGGYTRIIKIGRRSSDGSEMVLLEWVGITAPDRKKKKKAEKADAKA
jgi:large subunit ribosomal protein L17